MPDNTIKIIGVCVTLLVPFIYIFAPEIREISGFEELPSCFSEKMVKYKGTIGDSHIEISLVFSVDKTIKGTYFYNKTKIPIPLTGKLRSNEISLKAELPNNEGVECIELSLENKCMMKGEWTHHSNKQILPISLKQL